ncbi:MAG: hypothetical protein WC943_15100, partial [Elusimicrobiota bacterium]
MDITTLLGFAAMAGGVVLGASSGQLPVTFLNWHGLFIVLGGTGAAMLVNTPLKYLFDALRASLLLFGGHRPYYPRAVLEAAVDLAGRVQSRGSAAFQEADPGVAGGYLMRAAQAAVEYNDADLVEGMLQTEIDQ